MSCHKCKYKDFAIKELTKLIEDITGLPLPPLPEIPKQEPEFQGGVKLPICKCGERRTLAHIVSGKCD